MWPKIRSGPSRAMAPSASNTCRMGGLALDVPTSIRSSSCRLTNSPIPAPIAAQKAVETR